MDALAALVLAKALATWGGFGTHASDRIRPRFVRILPGNSINCAGVDRATVRRCARLRNVHLFECVNLNLNTGEINGGVLNNGGGVRCDVDGVVFINVLGDVCSTVSVCGVLTTTCLNDPSTLGLLRCLGLV
jgi:hypothetical protein